MITTQDIVEIPEQQQWSQQLSALASKPLECCPHFPQIARRFDAWWAGELVDRPILIAALNGCPSRPITRRLELLDQPEKWLEAKLEDLQQTRWYGDAVPNMRVDLGAGALGALLDCPIEFGADTTWTHAVIHEEDWSDAPDWTLKKQGHWWPQMQRLLGMAAAAAEGRFLVSSPTLGGSADVLTNLRGATEICMDVLEQPDRVREAIQSLYPAWHESFRELYRQVLDRGVGLVHWHLLWSNKPYVITECDLGFSIGPNEYRDICLPDIARVAGTTGRSIFHLDGPGSTRQLDALLEVPDIRAIQYTPGAGAPSALAWVEMFQKIQQKGRSALIFAPAAEVLELYRVLKPEGLAILVEGPCTQEQMEEIERGMRQQFGQHL